MHRVRRCMRVDIDAGRAIGCAGRYYQRDSAEIGAMVCRDLREKVAYENAGDEVIGHDTRDLSTLLGSNYLNP